MSDKTYLLDSYVTEKPGDPFRLFQYKSIFKGGKKREITKETKFNFPQWSPQIKLGSHKDECPAGGSITSLDYRDDGIWANVELNEEGREAFEKGKWKFQSPEVIWEGGVEDPDNGEIIEGPLIVGVALLHTPHLGNDAALYTYEQLEDNSMTELTEVVEQNTTVMKKILSIFEKPEPEPAPQPETEDYSAIEKERDDYAAELKTLKADKEKAELMTAIKGEFEKEEFGTAYIELGKTEKAAEMLAEMSDEQRAWVIQEFGALSKQIDESKLTGELGEDDPVPLAGTDAFSTAVTEHQKENKVEYMAAVQAVAKEKPELYASYLATVGGR